MLNSLFLSGAPAFKCPLLLVEGLVGPLGYLKQFLFLIDFLFGIG